MTLIRSVTVVSGLCLSLLVLRHARRSGPRDGDTLLTYCRTLYYRFIPHKLRFFTSESLRIPWIANPKPINAIDALTECLERKPSADGLITSQRKLILVMVGLPARGKSFVVRKIVRYLNWLGFPAQVFNVGNTRRKECKDDAASQFFAADNVEAVRVREELAMKVLNDLLLWLDKQGHVAIFDATNTTQTRRKRILEVVRGHSDVRIMFVENICDNPKLLEENYKRKLMNEDYVKKHPEEAMADFMERVAQYEKVYQTLEDSEDDGRICYIKSYNAGEKLQARLCQGFLQSHIVSLLENIHLHPKRIWLVRPGSTITSSKGILGLDTKLSAQGHMVAKAIAQFVSELKLDRRIDVWTGTNICAKQTIKYLPQKRIQRIVRTTLLNELGGGNFQGLTYDEIKHSFPRHFAARNRDKLRYRYPGVGGESYMDVIIRLRSLIIEFERKRRDVMIICGNAVMRSLMGYFKGYEADEVPHLNAHENIVFQLSPERDGCDIHSFHLSL